MDIDSNCPSLIFGETTSHLTSKWRGTFQYFFNVENTIKREMRKNYLKNKIKKKTHPPPPDFFFCLHQFFFLMLEIAWNAKKTWNIEKQKILFYFFQYLKNS